LVEPLEASALPRFVELEPVFRRRCLELWGTTDGRIAAYPAYWGLRGLVVDAGQTQAADSWRTLLDAAPGQAWLNSQGSEVIAELALALGYPSSDVYNLAPDQLASVSEQLEELCERIGGVWRLLPELEEAFRQGATVAEVHSTSLVYNLSQAANRELTVVLPREGTVGWVDGAMISAAAPRRDEALALIELMLSPEGVLSQWEQSDGYWSTNADAMSLIANDARFRQKAALAVASVDAFLHCALYQPPARAVVYARVWASALRRVERVPQSVREATTSLASGSD
jgi:spermidine/putrescine transport system substrate-binding protein